MKRILVALDASARAAHVLDTAVQLSAKLGGTLTVLRVVGIPVEIPMETWSVAPAQLADSLVEAAQQSLRTLVANIPPGLLEDVSVEVGVPWQTICEVAGARDCDLIVLGTHGHSMLDRLLGTTAARVANHAPCSVFMVRSNV